MIVSKLLHVAVACVFLSGNYCVERLFSMYTAQFSITAVFPEGNYPFIIDDIGHLEMQLETDKRVFFRRMFVSWPTVVP